MFQTGRREQSNGTKAVAFSDFAIFVFVAGMSIMGVALIAGMGKSMAVCDR